MASVFWYNTAPYLLLFLTSLVVLILAFKKSADRRFTFAFTAATLDFAFYVEFILLILLNAYAYHPGISSNAFQDTAYGNLFSQFSIATTSAFLIVYRLSYYWYIFVAFIYFIIDVLFAKLGIYEHFWYRSVYTLIGFGPLLLLIGFWHHKLTSSPTKLLRWITLQFSTNAIMYFCYTIPLRLTGIQVFSAPFFSDAVKNHATTNVVYGLVVPFIMIWIAQAKMHWSLKGLSLGAVLLFKYILVLTGIVTIRSGWFIPAALIEIAARYFLIIQCNRFLRPKLDTPRAAA